MLHFDNEHLRVTRFACRIKLREQGDLNFIQIQKALRHVTPDHISQALKQASEQLGRPIVMPGTLTDRIDVAHIFEVVWEWLISPEGQAVVLALIKILLLFI